MYPGQAYFWKHNLAVKRAEENYMDRRNFFTRLLGSVGASILVWRASKMLPLLEHQRLELGEGTAIPRGQLPWEEKQYFAYVPLYDKDEYGVIQLKGWTGVTCEPIHPLDVAEMLNEKRLAVLDVYTLSRAKNYPPNVFQVNDRWYYMTTDVAAKTRSIV